MKVISGGQTGADQAGLAAARELGLATGGFLPKDCWTDEGSRPDLLELYGMQECEIRGYPERTERNVTGSNGTIIFGNSNSPGCRLTIKLCRKYKKPYLVVSYPSYMSADECAVVVSRWLAEKNIIVLNVAGNRERTNVGIFEFTKSVLLLAL